MILEGLVTTLNDDGTPHLAPMGPIVDATFTKLTLRPYATSTTGGNLLARREGVFHVTDDVGMLTRAAVGELAGFPEYRAASRVSGVVLTGSCRAYEFRIVHADASSERRVLGAEVVATHQLRDFIGFHRAKHAVLEAAIHATRFFLLDRATVEADYRRCQTIVDKTGDDDERAAMALLWTKFHAAFPSDKPRAEA